MNHYVAVCIAGALVTLPSLAFAQTKEGLLAEYSDCINARTAWVQSTKPNARAVEWPPGHESCIDTFARLANVSEEHAVERQNQRIEELARRKRERGAIGKD
jgi:hypothetical protein